jgi:hypothetical protein
MSMTGRNVNSFSQETSVRGVFRMSERDKDQQTEVRIQMNTDLDEVLEEYK